MTVYCNSTSGGSRGFHWNPHNKILQLKPVATSFFLVVAHSEAWGFRIMTWTRECWVEPTPLTYSVMWRGREKWGKQKFPPAIQPPPCSKTSSYATDYTCFDRRYKQDWFLVCGPHCTSVLEYSSLCGLTVWLNDDFAGTVLSSLLDDKAQGNALKRCIHTNTLNSYQNWRRWSYLIQYSWQLPQWGTLYCNTMVVEVIVWTMTDCLHFLSIAKHTKQSCCREWNCGYSG